MVGVQLKGVSNLWTVEESLVELGQLAKTAGAQLVATLSQHLDKPTSHYLGKGKLEDLKELRAQHDCEIVIFDDELTPTQQRNLERALQVKVIDRSALILDIFSRHARTREGQLQVELAQHQYLLPRLAGQWAHLERLGGGIGTRGPGETQIETDRRLIRGRIKKLSDELERVRTHRVLHRSRRRQSGLPIVALVGYTNAGKSTLFNALSSANVAVVDKPFATLDPVTRRVRLPEGDDMLLTDTVGFINKLPPTLVSAFHATLEDLHDADILLHVIDSFALKANQQALVVEETLNRLGLAHKSRLLVMNKVDLASSRSTRNFRERAWDAGTGTFWGVAQRNGDIATEETVDTLYYPMVAVSSSKGWNMEGLLEEIQGLLTKAWTPEPR